MKCLLLAGALALSLSTAARAEDSTISAVCSPYDEAAAAKTGFRQVSRDEWLALRVIYRMLPSTIDDFPPGDGAILQEQPDGTGMAFFIDAGEACSPMHLHTEVVGLIKSLRANRITHPKGGA